MFEVKELFRVSSYDIDKETGFLVKRVDTVTKSAIGQLTDKLHFWTEPRTKIMCYIPHSIDKTAHTAQMIADALNMKLATAMSGVATDDPWQMPVPLDVKEK